MIAAIYARKRMIVMLLSLVAVVLIPRRDGWRPR